ncbi:MAG: hypothetical protein B6245_19080 [Desulfobacteraceae bacterium 4572_88]|nr:MAG: hypothetical protein B6245_19080 [Desulfobacteraceae bacterium 4572_88]
MKALRKKEILSEDDIFYPESDGKPMAENTRQYEWIVMIKEGLEVLFRDDPDVFVAADLLWYPTEGDRHTCAGPDVMVALGRPKGHRGSYLQWKEDGVAPQAVFEILSPGNRAGEMRAKLEFYERHGILHQHLLGSGHVLPDHLAIIFPFPTFLVRKTRSHEFLIIRQICPYGLLIHPHAPALLRDRLGGPHHAPD